MSQDRWDSKNLHEGSPSNLTIFKTHIEEFIDNGSYPGLTSQIWGGVDLNAKYIAEHRSDDDDVMYDYKAHLAVTKMAPVTPLILFL